MTMMMDTDSKIDNCSIDDEIEECYKQRELLRQDEDSKALSDALALAYEHAEKQTIDTMMVDRPNPTMPTKRQRRSQVRRRRAIERRVALVKAIKPKISWVAGLRRAQQVQVGA